MLTASSKWLSMPELTTGESRVPNIPAEMRDKKSPVWDMSQERAFLEALLNQRFNFFLVFFSLVLAGTVNSKTVIQFRVVSTLGFVVGAIFALPIFRAQRKLDLIMKHLYADPTHPACMINLAAAEAGGLTGRSMQRLIGYYLPSVFVITMMCVALVANFDPSLWLPAGSPPAPAQVAESAGGGVDAVSRRVALLEDQLRVARRDIDSLRTARRP
jgi:hypothetical protein